MRCDPITGEWTHNGNPVDMSAPAPGVDATRIYDFSKPDVLPTAGLQLPGEEAASRYAVERMKENFMQQRDPKMAMAPRMTQDQAEAKARSVAIQHERHEAQARRR